MNILGSEKQQNYGIIRLTAGQHADGRATRQAIHLAALADCRWPSHDEQLVKVLSEVVVNTVIDFALYARRSLEADDIRGICITDVHERFGFHVNVPKFGGNLWDALGKIIHAKDIIVVTWTTGAELFTSAGDRRISHLKVQSDKGDEVYLCPFGLAHAYLSRLGREYKQAQGDRA